MPLRSMTSNTTSVEEAPICKPTLPPSSASITGASQAVWALLRQLTMPLPYLPPTTKPAFFIPGMMATQSALSRTSLGIPLSGAAMISSKTVAAAFSLSLTSSANAVAVYKTIPITKSHSFFIGLPPHRNVFARHNVDDSLRRPWPWCLVDTSIEPRVIAGTHDADS
jgi:hypothetical protein